MDSEDRFWCYITLIISISVLSLIICSQVYYTKKNEVILEALKIGKDPIYVKDLYNAAQ